MDRRGNWIQTYTGRQFWPLDPRSEDVEIDDIAHALAMLCRFNGHTLEFYSVAQHSVIVSQTVAADHALWGLLHDAAEAYIGDMVRPLKHDPQWVGDDFMLAEQGIQMAIARKFGMRPWMPTEIADADARVLAAEARDMVAEPPADWELPDHLPAIQDLIQPMTPRQSEVAFLDRFDELYHAK